MHVGRGHGGIEAREGEAGRNLEQHVAGRGQRVGHAGDGQVAHLLDAADEHHVVGPGGDGQDALAQGNAAAGAGVLDARGRAGGQPHPVGHDRRGVALALE